MTIVPRGWTDGDNYLLIGGSCLLVVNFIRATAS